MRKYRGKHLIRAGFIGVMVAVLAMLIGLAPQRFVTWATSVQYRAVFSEAGGLAEGNAVMVSGLKVGSVSKISLDNGDVVVDFAVKGTVRPGSETTAHIQTRTLLGERALVLQSAGGGELKPGTTIPLSRTSSPYTLTDAVNDLTSNTAATDTGQLNQSLDTLSATLDQIGPQLGPAFDGLARLSKSLNNRNESLRDLLSSAGDVTKVLSQRSQQVNTLILNANTLLSVLVERRQAIVDLLANTSAVAKQLSGLVADNEAQLAPTLDRLNSVTAMLEKNRDNIAKAIPGLTKFSQILGETISSGSYYNAFVANLTQGPILQPIINAVFNQQPRALFPFPTCGDDGDCYNREEELQPNSPEPPAPR
jgi:phospholipid/cholesterol/gamma-HCH transport system substrate-binding protein